MYADSFSPDSFWSKLANCARKAGKKLVYLALLLYYTATAGSTPYNQKMLILGALAYLVLPVDLIPDFLPGGYVDDMGALMAAYKAVKGNITPAIKAQAERTLASWFSGPVPAL